MGCDIKAFIEYSFTQSDGSKVFGYWNWVPLERNYILFSLMANVRNRAQIDPLFLPRGVPQDLSDQAQEQYEYDRERYGDREIHSHSWLSLREMREVRQRYCSFSDQDESYLLLDVILAAMEVLEQDGNEESRLVFWFDN